MGVVEYLRVLSLFASESLSAANYARGSIELKALSGTICTRDVVITVGSWRRWSPLACRTVQVLAGVSLVAIQNGCSGNALASV